jgi:hypothetical protein
MMKTYQSKRLEYVQRTEVCRRTDDATNVRQNDGKNSFNMWWFVMVREPPWLQNSICKSYLLLFYSSAGIATGCGARRPRGRNSRPGRVKNFLFSTSSRPALGSTQLPIQLLPWGLSPGVKRPGSETDHWPPASVKVKQLWIYISLPHTLN